MIMFGAGMFLSMEQNEHGKWKFAILSASANGENPGGGESGGGEDCFYTHEVFFEGLNIIPMDCCLTRYEYYVEYFECYSGSCGANTGNCGTKSVTYNTYQGVMCCA